MNQFTHKKKKLPSDVKTAVDKSLEDKTETDPSELPLNKIGINLFNTTQKTIDSKSLDVKIDLFIHDQARLFWYYKGCPPQDQNGELDDYYNAKRYVMFLIADKLIYSCKNQSQCPFEVILQNNILIKYLQSLSVKEYLFTKAYLSYKNRMDCNTSYQNSLHDEDYYHAEKYLQSAATGIHNKCKHYGKNPPIEYWNRIISTGWPCSIADIKNAKTRALVRLNIQDSQKFNSIVNFVENFYDKITPIIENKQIPEVTLIQLVQYFYSNKTIVNMFEFFLRCFLVSRLEKETFDKLTMA